MCKNKQNTSKQPLQCGLLPASAEPSPHPQRTRGTFHRWPEPLYLKKQKVSCPVFLPKRSPCNIHAGTTMCLATSGSRPGSLGAHGNTKRQQSCSHDTAICNQRVKKRIDLRTHEQPLVAEHRGGTDRARFERSRTPRTHEVPFIAGRSHFTRKNTRFPAPSFTPKRSPCNIHAATTMRFCKHQVAKPHLSTNMATQSDTIMRPLQYVLQAKILTPPFIEHSLTLLIVPHLSVTRKIASQLPLIMAYLGLGRSTKCIFEV